MIYDGFIFFNEFELLEIRLNELWDVVDKFILVEAYLTHSGKPKPMYFKERKGDFEKYLSKIIHVEVYNTPNSPKDVSWDREIHQRNSILDGVSRIGVTDDDILIVSDVDEIVRASAVKTLGRLIKPVQFAMQSFGGYVNTPSGPWNYAKAGPVRLFLEGLAPQICRHNTYMDVPNGGWHFSYLGGPAKICEKMSAFSHQEERVQRHNDLARITANLAQGHGVFGGKFSVVEVDDTWPAYLVKNREKFSHLFYKPA